MSPLRISLSESVCRHLLFLYLSKAIQYASCYDGESVLLILVPSRRTQGILEKQLFYEGESVSWLMSRDLIEPQREPNNHHRESRYLWSGYWRRACTSPAMEASAFAGNLAENRSGQPCSARSYPTTSSGHRAIHRRVPFLCGGNVSTLDLAWLVL